MITKMDPNWTRKCCKVKIKYSFRMWEHQGSMIIPMKATMSPWDAMKWHLDCEMDGLIIAIQEAKEVGEQITFETMSLEWDESGEVLSGTIGNCDFDFDRPEELLDQLVGIEILEWTPLESTS